MEPKVDGEFELYGGKIQGKNLELVIFQPKRAIILRKPIRESSGTGNSKNGKTFL
jgi:hypothetical protein